MSERWRHGVDVLWHPSVLDTRQKPEMGSDNLIDYLVAKFWKGELPTPAEMNYVIDMTTKVLSLEPNVLELKGPITVCGDLHGQFDDLIEIFNMCGLPPYTKYLFLGDYVDRGSKGVEVIMLLCILKLKYRDNFFILRGNHECMSITQVYGFRQEILTKYRSTSQWTAFQPLFSAIPIAAVVDKSIFCVHGGISKSARLLSEIAEIDRFTEIPLTGALCELVWSDPANDESGFTESKRKVGNSFGEAASDEFLKLNSLKMIVRAHQVMNNGCGFCQNQKVLTVFSAPNYESYTGNRAGILVLDEKCGPHLVRFKQDPTRSRQSDLLSLFVY